MTRLIASLLLATPLCMAASALGPTPHRTDTNHSSVGFSVPIYGGLSYVTGKFSRFTMDFQFDAEDPTQSKVLAVIDSTSVDTGIDGRDQHMQAEDFFHTEKYPEIVYESFEVQTTDDPDRLVVIGVLTVRDQSHDVLLDVRVLRDPEHGTSVGFHATTSFDRHLFGVSYQHREIPNFIGDEVEIDLRILTSPRG